MRRDRRWGTTTTHHCFLPAAHPKAQEEVSREVATLRRDVEEQAAALRIFPPCHGDGWYMLVLVLDGIWGIIRLVNYYFKINILSGCLTIFQLRLGELMICRFEMFEVMHLKKAFFLWPGEGGPAQADDVSGAGMLSID